MNGAYIYMLLVLSGVSLYSADKDIQQLSDTKTCPDIIVHEDEVAVHTDIYYKLLGISRTLKDQINDSDKQAPLPNEQYHPVNCDPLVLKHITNYITAQNTDTYLKTLSLIELVHLYQEADFWAVDAHILDTIRNSIISQLRNADTLTRLFSNKENLSHFISACNTVTLDTLARALHTYTYSLLAQPLTCHNGVNSLKVHTDGTLFLCSWDRTISVWKTDAQGHYYCAQTLRGHIDSVCSIAVHTDGTLFSGSYDGTIRVWKQNAQDTYHCVQTLTGHTHSVKTVAIHTEGTLFSGSGDRTIRVWKKDEQGIYYCMQILIGQTDCINSIAVHIDGTLFSCSDNATIRVWKQDAHRKYKRVQTLTGHTNSVCSVAVHSDGTLFSGAWDHTIRVWKKDEQEIYYCMQTLTGHNNWINTLAVHTDGTLFSGSRDHTIIVWKKDTQGIYYCMQILAGQTGFIDSIAVHTNSTLFSCEGNRIIRIGKPLEEHMSLEQYLLVHWLYTTYQLNGNTQINTLPAHQFHIYRSLPQSIKDHIVTWYKPGYIKYLFSKPYVWASGGLIAGCTALGAYLYYKWFRK